MVTTITTSVADASAATLNALALITIVALMGLLIQKEIAIGLVEARAKRFSDALTVVTVPLVLIFLLIFFLRVLDATR